MNEIQQVENLKNQLDFIEEEEYQTGENFTDQKYKILDQIYFILNNGKNETLDHNTN